MPLNIPPALTELESGGESTPPPLPSDVTLPAAFDARKKWVGCIGDPETQGACGSCWAFAAVGVLSDRFCIFSCSSGLPPSLSPAPVSCAASGYLRGALTNGSANAQYEGFNRIFAAQALGAEVLFYKILGLVPSEDAAPAGADCSLSPASIDAAQWERFFTRAYRRARSGASVQERTSGLTDIALMELGSGLGLYLPMSAEDSVEVATQKIRMYFKFWDSNDDGRISLCEWRAAQSSGPVRLSVQKLLVCLTGEPVAPATVLTRSGDVVTAGELSSSTACVGGSLAGAWRYLRDSGTPIAACVGYTFQSGSVAASVLPRCMQLLGPESNRCPGFVSHGDWTLLRDLIRTSSAASAASSTRAARDRAMGLAGTRGESVVPSVSPLLHMYRALNAYSICNSEAHIRLELLTQGPVSTGYTLYADFVPFFQRAAATTAKTPAATPESLIYAWDRSSPSTGGHAVALVGWGATPRGAAYWVVRNSWGVEWGHSGDSDGPGGVPSNMRAGGYFWIRRGTNECGIEENVVVGQPDMASVVYPNTIRQPSEKDIASCHTMHPPGYNCIYKSSRL